MSKKIKGGLEVGRYATTQGKNLTQTVYGNTFDASGNLELDVYTREEFDQIISVLPLSHYGSYNYLPAGVNGSFVGASDVPIYRYRKIQVEDDGVLTILRSGSNGSVRGLYYSYIDNILTTTDLNTSINTNKEYKPGYFGSTYTAKMAFASDPRVVSGIAFNASNAEYIFVSWAAGTLNDNLHSGCMVPVASLKPNGGNVRFVMTGNTEIFFFVDTRAGNNKYTLELRSIPISQVQNSVASPTITEYTNWTNNTFYGNVINDTNILLNNVIVSSNPADQPYVLAPSSYVSCEPYMTGVDIYAAQNSAGVIRLRVVGDCYCATLSANNRPKHSYSILINPSTKVTTLEAGNTAPLTITDNGSAVLQSSGNTLTTDPILTYNGNRGNMVMAYYYLDTGTVIGIGSENTADNASKIQRARYPGVTSVYDTLQVRSHTSTDYIVGSMNTSYGSPVGSDLMSFEWLPNNRYKVGSYVEKSQFKLSLNEYKPNPTFTFGSVSLGTINGFEPTSNRKFVTESYDNTILISSITGSTVTTNGGVLIQDNKLTSPLSYDQDLNPTGTISISNTLLLNLKTQQMANSTIPLDLNNASNITLYVPRQTDIPVFALITGVTTSYTNYTKVVEVNVNTRSGTITSLSFNRLVHESSGFFDSLKADSRYGVPRTAVGITIYDAGSFYMIGGCDPYQYSTVGDSNAITWRAKVTKGTPQIDSFVVSGVYKIYAASNSSMPFAVPGVGFGYIDFVRNAADDKVRVIFQPTGTTLAQYNAWTPVGSPILLGSQDVAQGFIIYFTEKTSVLLSGKSFTLPIMNIDLTTIKANPANSTFYIYVQLKEGLASYIASETVIAESGTSAYNTFWIGTVTTNAIQIDNIAIQKRSRLDVYGTSLEAAGSSFPVSYGLPSSTGTINW